MSIGKVLLQKNIAHNFSLNIFLLHVVNIHPHILIFLFTIFIVDAKFLGNRAKRLSSFISCFLLVVSRFYRFGELVL